MSQTTIFLDGKIVQARRALINSLAPGTVEGQGVFETIRVANGNVYNLEEHLNRMARGLRIFKIKPPCSRRQWRQRLSRIIRINGFTQAGLRIAVWRQHKRVRIAIVGRAIKGHAGPEHKAGMTAIISSVKRNKSRYSNVKSIAYECFRRAWEEARQNGFDEALLLNNRREIVEGSRTNIFYASKGKLFTPAVRCGCLNGITRKTILCCAREINIPCSVTRAPVARLIRADEAFVTNALIGIVPLISVNSHVIGTGEAGSLTRRLMEAYYRKMHLSCPPKSKSL